MVTPAPTTSPTEIKPLRKLPLHEWGAQLPIGTTSPGADKLNKGLAAKRFRLEEERHLTRKQREAVTMTRFVSEVLIQMLTTFGHHDFATLEEPQKRLVINQAALPDVMYAWLWLRSQAVGSTIEMEHKCGGCRLKYKQKADLTSTDVTVVDELSQLVHPFTLADGLELGGKVYKHLLLAPPLWAIMENLTIKQVEEMGAGDVKAMMMRGSIRSIKGYDAPLLGDFTDSMTLSDANALMQDIDDNNPGPDLSVETCCPRCNTTDRQPMDWSYGSFFGKSGR